MCHVCHDRRFSAAQNEGDEGKMSLLLVILPGCLRTLEGAVRERKAVMTMMS